jgi:6-phosphogluconolactonase (cycloisomerase 2 family)
LTKSLTLGGQPTWMTWNSTSRTIYVSDESYASGYVAAVSAGTDGSLTLQGKAPATAQAVANCQYGNGGYIAVAH